MGLSAEGDLWWQHAISGMFLDDHLSETSLQALAFDASGDLYLAANVRAPTDFGAGAACQPGEGACDDERVGLAVVKYSVR